MKKIVTVILVCFCFSPVFAQGGKAAVELATGKGGAEITRQVQEGASQAARVEQMVRSMDLGAALRYTDHAMQLSELEAARVPEVADLSSASNVQNALENAPKKSLHLQEKLANLKRVIWKKRATELFSPSAPRIKITNLPGEPTVKLDLPLPPANNGVSTKYLKAHVLGPDVRANILFPQGWLGNSLYIPSSWQYRDKNFWYRGMLLHHTEELKNILINGLELDKTRHTGIFASSEIASALRYAADDVPTFMALPVLIRISKTSQLSTPAMPCGLALFRQDIPVGVLTDVMVFLEVNGKPDWYRATLEDGELVFTPAPSRVFTDDELIIHKFGRDE